MLVNDGSFDAEQALRAGPMALVVDIPPTTSASWGDFDRDGDLTPCRKLRSSRPNGRHPDLRFRPRLSELSVPQHGDVIFEDVSRWLPQIVHDGYTYAGGWHDVDDDGWLDLLTVNDFGPAYRTLRCAIRGTLVEGWRDHLWVETTGMGLGVADLNRDGYLDLPIPEYDNHPRRSSVVVPGEETWWLDVALSLNIPDSSRNQMVGWGGVWRHGQRGLGRGGRLRVWTVHPNWTTPQRSRMRSICRARMASTMSRRRGEWRMWALREALRWPI